MKSKIPRFEGKPWGFWWRSPSHWDVDLEVDLCDLEQVPQPFHVHCTYLFYCSWTQYHQLCNLKPTMVSLSSVIPSLIDHKDISFQTFFPYLIPLFKPLIPLILVNTPVQENRHLTVIILSKERKQKSWNKTSIQQRLIHKPAFKPLIILDPDAKTPA